MTQASRHNEGKRCWSLVYFKSLEELIEVLEFGASKYAPENWKKGLNREELLESTMRHLVKLFEGEELDSDSGLPHTAHVMCNMMFYTYFRNNASFSPNRVNNYNNKTTKHKQ